ncbi:MAG: toxin-antitoxin system HicB family antitoxin [Kiritimatiellae bacterium]|jgi:predicted HicB family RNase H-like nuclease|nr:toxin-antitoxin system HicB family antitoxin [Kiritimatiellia bacterium]NCC92450.1 toxin-antitoxin system HicB family antitoxin [Opitutae bacterium]
MKAGDQYLKIVEWSEEDGCYVGTCPGLMLGGIHGDDETKVYRELCQAVDEWIEIYRRDGQPLPAATAGKNYSGKFVVRVGAELHRTMALNALRRGESLNSYCVGLLREGGARYGREEAPSLPPRKSPRRSRK